MFFHVFPDFSGIDFEMFFWTCFSPDFPGLFDQNGPKIDCRDIPRRLLFATVPRRFLKIDFWTNFGRHLSPFGRPLASFWTPLAALWLILDAFGWHFALIWSLFAPFATLLDSPWAPLGAVIPILAIFLAFLHKLSCAHTHTHVNARKRTHADARRRTKHNASSRTKNN